MSATDCPSFPIDPPDEPSQEFLRAINVAGNTLESQFKKHRGQGRPSHDYNWIKSELIWPSFDHLTFAFGNQVFSVLVELTDGTHTSLSSRERERCFAAARDFRLIPCVFPVHPVTLTPCFEGWNLFDLKEGFRIIPAQLATDELIPMSEWELQNFAIQIVRDHIKQKLNGRIHSYSDIIGINPQIWFEDEGGKGSWVIVRFCPIIRGGEKNEFVGFERSSPHLEPLDGHFSAVSAASAAPVLYDLNGDIIPLSRRYDGTAPVYRGDGFYVKFDGLQRIYVS